MITGENYDIRYTDIFNYLNWNPIIESLDKRAIVMIYKILKGMAPNYLIQLFSKRENLLCEKLLLM